MTFVPAAALPVADILPALVQQLASAPQVVLTAPPGAGKSTYLPLYLLQQPAYAGKKIIMLEPRRLAAKSIAAYLAQQLGEAVGQTVGYQIRLEQKQSAATRLLVVTEGVLIRKMLQDAMLEDVDLLIFDEFHERSLQTDLALALALEVQQLNDQLKLLLMSATLDTDKLSQQLQAPVLQSLGRSFPVDVRYQVPTQQPLALQCGDLVLQALAQHAGNLLVFLPGQREIDQCADYLLQKLPDASVKVHALIGSLSLAEQQAAIAAPPPGQRKVVLATNIAETSLTIDGISVVIDSGQARAAVFEPKLGFSKLETIQISQAAATQRAGRAGRLMPGVCYRLDTAEKWQRRRAQTIPDILQADLLALRLDIAGWGARVSDLFWLDSPPEKQLRAAEQCLQLLGALDDRLQLTNKGRQMLRLPVEPRLAAMLLHARELEQQGESGAVSLAATMAAQIEQTRRFTQTELSSQLRLQTDMAKQQYQQLLQLMQGRHSQSLPLALTPELLSRAFPDRIALSRGQGYLLANGTGASLPPDDTLQGTAVLVVADLRLWQQQAVISLAEKWSLEALIQSWQADLHWQNRLEFDEQSGRFIAEKQLRLGALVLKRQQSSEQINADDRRQAWLDYLQKKGLQVLNWSAEALQWQQRIALARQLQPEQHWPDLSLPQLQETQADWLGPYLDDVRSLHQLQQLNLLQILRNRLDYAQQQKLDALLPASWRSVLGTYVALDYQPDGEVHLAIRLQEMFGQLTTPTVGQGAVVVTITLLSPAKRPLQVTRDLASFWQNAYQDVKKEMRGRYPKHYWPDDPAEAEPTNKTKKAMANKATDR
jgi:ATP-dependent helicase HrpB